MDLENKQLNHEPKNLTQKLIDQIKKNKISPRPRWYFWLRNSLIWTAAGLALIISALAISVMAYLFQYNDLAIYQRAHKSLVEVLLRTLPYFWLIFLAIFIFIIYYNIRKTKKGYRYSLTVIISFSIITSLILGALFHKIGWGQAIDDVLGARAPLYGQVFNRQMDFWFEPQDGRLVGLVISQDEKDLMILDPDGKLWEVQLPVRQDLETIPDFIEEFIKIGLPISLIGQVLDENSFQAEIIRPMGPLGRKFIHRPVMDSNPDCPRGGCLLDRPPFRH